MKEKIFILLDELVSMSNSQFTTESLELELADVNKKITRINNTIKKFESSINDSKYFDISSQMMDKNVEINLKKRIASTQDALEEIEVHLQDALAKEKENHVSLDKTQSTIADYEKLVKILKQKQNILKNEDAKNIYEDLIAETTNKLHLLEDDKDQALLCKSEIEKELDLLSTSKQELIEKLEEEKQKLTDTQKELANEKNYYDYEAKRMDEDYLSELNEKLSNYEHQKLQLLTDPANLAIEAKKIIIEGSVTEAISKIKELVSVIEEIPDIKEKNVNKLQTKRDELRAEIENKKNDIGNKEYKTKENTCLESRIDYLTDFVNELKNRSMSIKTMIDDIDNKSVIELKLEITASEENKKDIMENIEQLEELKDNNNSVNLIASIKSYQKELNTINKTIEKQTNDLEYLVNLSCMLENNVSNLEKKIAEKNNEITSLERELSLKSKLIDEKSKIEDEDQLNSLQKELDYIENRLKYKRTPEDIYNDIDCLLGSLDFDEPVKRTRLSRSQKYNEIKPTSEPEKTETLQIKEPIQPKKKRLKIVDIEEPKKESEQKPEPTNYEKEPEDIGFNEILSLIGDTNEIK